MRTIPLLPTMYRWIAGRGSRSMFLEDLEMSVEMVDAGLTFRIWHALKYEVSEEYFLITKGVLEATPLVLGYAPASVTMSRSGPSATYNIVLPARKRLRDRFVAYPAGAAPQSRGGGRQDREVVRDAREAVPRAPGQYPAHREAGQADPDR